jgi:hypothetical protein
MNLIFEMIHLLHLNYIILSFLYNLNPIIILVIYLTIQITIL